MRILMVAILGIGLNGCSQTQQDFQNWIAGFQEEIVLVKMQGQQPKAPDSYRLDKIKQGVNELREMNDPKIAAIYKLVSSRLKDSHLSLNDYYVISLAIHQHKEEIQQQNGTQKLTID